MFLAQSAASSADASPLEVVLFLAIGIPLFLLPSFLAYRKGRSVILFFLFSFLCWLPTLIYAIVIADQTASRGGNGRYNMSPPVWHGTVSARSYQSGPPPGWYTNPRGRGRERYWDGTFWSDNTR